jgi:ABC-type cobalamin transport system ATPase subunit
MPVSSHVLILKSGRVLGAGPKNAVMKSPLFSTAFNARVRLAQAKRRYTLNVSAVKRVVI